MKTFFVTGEISQSHLISFLRLNPTSADLLRVFVSSGGGDMSACTGLIDMWGPLREAGNLQTVACGEVCSAATLLVAAGSPDLRMTYRHTVWGVHEPYLTSTREEVTHDHVAEFNFALAAFYQLLRELTGRRESFWRRRLTGGQMRFYSAKEARRLGLVDVIL